MYFVLCAELLLGVLAVFGLYTILRSILAPDIPVVLELLEDTAAKELAPLLEQAENACFFSRRRVVALLGEGDRHNTALLEALRAADVKIYFVQD